MKTRTVIFTLFFGILSMQSLYGSGPDTKEVYVPIRISESNPGIFPGLKDRDIYRFHPDTGLSIPLTIQTKVPLKEAIETALNREKDKWLEGIFSAKNVHSTRQRNFEDIKIIVDHVCILSAARNCAINTIIHSNQLKQTPEKLRVDYWNFSMGEAISRDSYTIDVTLEKAGKSKKRTASFIEEKKAKKPREDKKE